MKNRKKLVCPVCGNDTWGYFRRDWMMCMECGRIVRVPYEYDCITERNKMLIEYIPEESCKN